MTTHEKIARSTHNSGYGCSYAVYDAFSDVNKHMSAPPAARSEGGKCGAVLAAEKTLRDMGITSDFDKKFLQRFGSLKCTELRQKRIPCNDLVGTAAAFVDEVL